MKTSFKLDIYLEIEVEEGTDRNVLSTLVNPILMDLETHCAEILSKEINFMPTGFKRRRIEKTPLQEIIIESKFLSKTDLLNGKSK